MTTINLNNRSGGASSASEYVILPTDMYRMKIVEASLEDDRFAKPNRDGSQPQKIALVWQVTVLTEEQQEVADEAGQEWSDVKIWHRFNPYYGDVRAGGPSKFKAFIDDLRKQGYLQDFDEEAFSIESLIGIEQKCSVLKYSKTMGENAGQPGNKITAFTSVRRGKTEKNVPRPVQPKDAVAVADEALPF